MSVLVSVVVPTFNEEQYIANCVESILRQDFAKQRMEIIFVEGRSTDDTRKILEAYQRKHPFIKILDNSAHTVPKAMNLGIVSAQGEYIIRLDAHCEYEKSYVSKCLESLNQTHADNVGGPMRAVATNYKGKAIAATHHTFFGLGGGRFHDEEYEGYVDTVYLGAFRKKTLQKSGLYNEKLSRNQDIELNSRIIQHGGRIYLNPQIKSYYYNRTKLIDFCRQNFENGKWCIYTFFVNKNALTLRHFVPLAFISGIGSLTLLSLVSPIFKLLLGLTVTAYGFCSLLFSFIVGLKKGMQYIPFLPVVFCALHFSYGAGSLCGLLTVKRWIKE